MDTNKKRSTSPIGIKDYFRKQAQEELKQFQPQKPRVASASEVFSPSLDMQEQQAMERSLASQQQQQPATPSAQMQHSILGRKAPVTQAFGVHNPGIEVFSKTGINSGTDFGVGEGTPVAVPDGQWQVVSTFDKAQGKGYIGNNQNSGYGNSVLVQNPQTGEKMRLSHLSQVNVKPGQLLQGGTVVGSSGATGNVTGAHLDLEYYDAMGRLANILESAYARRMYGEEEN